MTDRDLMPLRATLLEMRSAAKKHGHAYMGNMPEDPKKNRTVVLKKASSTGKTARFFCDTAGAQAGRFSVLMEEVGEVADAILVGQDPTEELIQVAAMALAWLDVDYELGLIRLKAWQVSRS